jgi:hypothetical protein
MRKGTLLQVSAMNNASHGLPTLLYALDCLEPGASAEARFALRSFEEGILSNHPQLFVDPEGLRELLKSARMDLITGNLESGRMKIRAACNTVSCKP